MVVSPVSQDGATADVQLTESLRSLLDGVASPVYVKRCDHTWLYANRSLGQLLGLSPDQCPEAWQQVVQQMSGGAVLRSQDDAFIRGEAESVAAVTLQGVAGPISVTGTRALATTAVGQVLVVTLKSGEATAQVQAHNRHLLETVQYLNGSLDKLRDLEATLKRITDRVRDSLDEKQILQTAVQELTEALNVRGSNTSLYDLEQGTSTIYYEYTTLQSSDRGRVSQMEAFPEVYHQLLEGEYFQFCSIAPNPVRGRVSMLACAIFDHRGVIGDLWLINNKEYGFSEYDIRLVQQVANQCAIAIRQARLYQESQSQVRELEQVNHLKDDFLSTVSHELRTPVTSMRVALQLLGATLSQEYGLADEFEKPAAQQGRVARYYRILQEECEREISLINDLLDLQRLDVGNHALTPQPINLNEWLPVLINGFQERAQSRGQTLRILLSDQVPVLISDLSSVDRIWAELLNNACKYTPPGGEISLSVTEADRGRLQFNLVNTGVEIPESELPKIFDKFYRVPSADPWKQGGTGLGLALVKKLVLHIEGTIEVTSGDGAVHVCVELPLSLVST